jgi:glycogen debranching enzyme
MPETVHIVDPATALHGGGLAMVSDPAGQLHAEALYGLFAGDTRVLSTYKFELNGSAWDLLGRVCLGHGSGQWHFQNKTVRDALGEIEAGTVVFTLRRRVDGALHDDFEIVSFAQRDVGLRFVIQLDADFADLFEVKEEKVPSRLRAVRLLRDDGFTLRYERAGFARALHLRFAPHQPDVLVGSRLHFDLALAHGDRWRCCLEAAPEVERRVAVMASDPHRPEPDRVAALDRLRLRAAPLLALPFERGRQDLHAIALPQANAPPFVAAGVPWFLTLFGRDALLPALMAGVAGSWLAEGALAALASHQAAQRDDFRDAEPGKLPHELRRDEKTHRGELPYSPYYGTHDAPSLYCLTLWHAWRWTGQRELLDRHLETAMRAIAWCESLGDGDGDGLQEYSSRSPKGYRNQGWKDAGDAVVDGQGRPAEPPLATVELQGYLFAAHLAMAELLGVCGDAAGAQRQREAAWALRQRVEQRYWMEDAGFYAFALDRDKRQVDAIASNPAHLLWCGLPDAERAAAVARRLLEPDLFSGWGLRTLSSDNPAYNPVSYQRGSVWPFDTLIAAAGLWRYGETEAAFALIEGMLQAAGRFESNRLPELFGGFERSYSVPVPYRKANAPQAWSAAVPLLATQLMLGVVPDAPQGRCHVRPCLPPWLPELALEGLRVGEGTVDIAARREGGRTVIVRMKGEGIEVVEGMPPAPLAGRPPASR